MTGRVSDGVQIRITSWCTKLKVLQISTGLVTHSTTPTPSPIIEATTPLKRFIQVTSCPKHKATKINPIGIVHSSGAYLHCTQLITISQSSSLLLVLLLLLVRVDSGSTDVVVLQRDENFWHRISTIFVNLLNFVVPNQFGVHKRLDSR